MKNRKSKLVTLVVLSMIVVFTACVTEESQAVEVEETVDVNEEEMELQEEVEKIVVDEEEMSLEENEVDNSEQEVETYDTALDWAIDINASEPTLTIWNKDSKEGIVLENNAEYIVKDGDQMVMCYPNKSYGLHFLNGLDGGKTPQTDILGLVEATSVHFSFEFIKESFEATFIEIDPVIDGIEYDLNITVVSDDIGEKSLVELREKNKEDEAKLAELQAWLETNYDEPKLLVWNEETYVKEAINDGGEYTLKEGDKIALYTPDNYVFDFAGSADYYSFVDALYEGQVAKIGYKLPEESMKLVLSQYMLDAEGGEIVASYTIITP